MVQWICINGQLFHPGPGKSWSLKSPMWILSFPDTKTRDNSISQLLQNRLGKGMCLAHQRKLHLVLQQDLFPCLSPSPWVPPSLLFSFSLPSLTKDDDSVLFLSGSPREITGPIGSLTPGREGSAPLWRNPGRRTCSLGGWAPVYGPFLIPHPLCLI